MNPLLSEMKHIWRQVQSNADSPMEMALMGAAGLIVFLAMMTISGKAVRNDNADAGSNLAVLAIGSLLAAGALAALRVYLVPHLGAVGHAPWLEPVVTLLVLLALVTPLLSMVQRTGYFSALLMLAVSLTLSAIAMTLVQGAHRAVEKGEVTFGKTRERTETINDFMDRESK